MTIANKARAHVRSSRTLSGTFCIPVSSVWVERESSQAAMMRSFQGEPGNFASFALVAYLLIRFNASRSHVDSPSDSVDGINSILSWMLRSALSMRLSQALSVSHLILQSLGADYS